MESSEASGSQKGMMAGSIASTLPYSSDEDPPDVGVRLSTSKRVIQRDRDKRSKSTGAVARSLSKGQVKRRGKPALPIRAHEPSRGRSEEVIELRTQIAAMESMVGQSQWDAARQQSQFQGEIAELRGTLIGAERHALLSTSHMEEQGAVRVLSTERRAMEEVRTAKTEALREHDRAAQASREHDRVMEQVEMLKKQLTSVMEDGQLARRKNDDEMERMKREFSQEWAILRKQAMAEAEQMRTLLGEERAKTLQEQEAKQQIIQESARMQRLWEEERMQQQQNIAGLVAESLAEREAAQAAVNAMKLKVQEKEDAMMRMMSESQRHREVEGAMNVPAVVAMATSSYDPPPPGGGGPGGGRIDASFSPAIRLQGTSSTSRTTMGAPGGGDPPSPPPGLATGQSWPEPRRSSDGRRIRRGMPDDDGDDGGGDDGGGFGDDMSEDEGSVKAVWKKESVRIELTPLPTVSNFRPGWRPFALWQLRHLHLEKHFDGL